MKRLLAYLFIVLGLGLTFSVNVNADDWYAISKHPKSIDSFIDKDRNKKQAIFLGMRKCYKFVNENLDKKGFNDCYLYKVFQGSAKQAKIIKKGSEKRIAEEKQKQEEFKPTICAGNNNYRFIYKPSEISKCIYPFYVITKDHGMYEWYASRILKTSDKKTEAEVNKNKKNNKYDKITEIENMYSEGFLSKSECEQVKSKILNTNEKGITSCDNIKVYTAKKKSDETKPTICAGNNNYRFIYKPSEISKCIYPFYVITKDHSMYEWYSSRIPKTSDKKTEVAKIEEPKQEEFKPKTKDVDNDAPIIEIAEAITVDSQAYTLKGKVKDESRFFLTIDDRPIKVAKNGQFEFEGFAIDPKEQLKIVAIDRWKNKSEKIINIEVKIKEVADLRLYEKPNPGKIKVRKDNNKIGIIIGIEKYQNLDNIDAPYANRDANAFKAYANLALGIPNKNLKVLIDDKATRGELLKSLKIWLPQITRGQKKDVYIFFAGHGLASDDGEDLHILPHNGDPILLEDTAISRVEMFDLINKVNPKSVTMFFDTCYSGQTRSEQMLVAGLRPVRIIADDQDTPNNFTIFTASNYDQTSGSISEAEHGIFSYYLMKGLEGNADENKDKKITNGELIAYLKNNVSQEAFSQNRSQEPMLAGDPNNILISYR